MASNTAKAKVAALQQIPNFLFHKHFSHRVEQRHKELCPLKEQHSHLHVSTCSVHIKYYHRKLDTSIVVQLEDIGLELSEWDKRCEE